VIKGTRIDGDAHHPSLAMEASMGRMQSGGCGGKSEKSKDTSLLTFLNSIF
jgi:hypothetical protein